MTTLNQLRERLEDLYLEPAVEETPSVGIDRSLNTTADTFVIDSDVLSPDEESYIAPARIVEIGNEYMRVETYDENTKTVTVERAVRGSEAETHLVTARLRIPNRFSRMSQIEALKAAIEGLWQPLFVAKEERATISTAGYVGLPLNTVRLLNIKYQSGRTSRWRSVPGELFSTHPMDKGRAAVQVAVMGNIGGTSRVGLRTSTYSGALCVVRYGVRVESPDDNDTDIEDLPQKWERIVLVDAAAQLLSAVDIDAQSQELLTEKIRLENFPVRSGSSISSALLGYREYLVSRAHKELIARYPRPLIKKRASAWRV